MASLNSQLKERENKLYTTKADFHLEYMKNHTAVPFIDPLSRRIADLITKRELEVLGIKPSESHTRKFFTIPEKQEKSLIIPPAPEPVHQKVPSKAEIKITVTKSIPTCPLSPFPNPPDLKATDDQALQQESNRKQTQEMIVNLETLNAFKEELHRDYPELGLNNSGEGSSFHTNELKELEEACKELCSEKSENKLKENCEGFSNLTEIQSRVKTEPPEEDKKNEGNLESGPKSDSEGLGQFKLRPEARENKSCNLFKNNSELTPGQSKFLSVQNDLPTNDFFNLQSSFVKASFLHSLQESVKQSVPRVHVDLLSCKATPIYFNTHVPSDSKVIMDNGIGPADSLRFLILNETHSPEKPEPKDTYSKNLVWMKKKNDRAKKMRESLDLKEMAKCTFYPFGKKKKRRGKKKMFESQFISLTPRVSVDLKDSKDFTFSTVKPLKKNVVTYVGLSPACTKIGYKEGCDVEKVIEKAVPLVDYKKVNSLI